jgi:hypothetical protein
MSRQKSEGQTHNLLIVNKSFKSVAQFTDLGTTERNHNYIHEEIHFRIFCIFLSL